MTRQPVIHTANYDDGARQAAQVGTKGSLALRRYDLLGARQLPLDRVQDAESNIEWHQESLGRVDIWQFHA